MMRRLPIALAALVVAVLAVRPDLAVRTAQAGVTSLWADDATLVKQLVELMGIHDELKDVSSGIAVTAAATEDLLRLHAQAKALVREVHDYSPEAFWRDFRADTYRHYPGFSYLEDGKLWRWKESQAASPVKTYELLGAIFGDLTQDLRDEEAAGRLDTREQRLRRFEAAGALSLSNEVEGDIEAQRAYLAELTDQVERLDGGDPASLANARATLLVAQQNSQIIRLLARKVRLHGLDYAFAYGERIAGQRSLRDGLGSLSKTFGAESEEAKRRKGKPYLINFSHMWK